MLLHALAWMVHLTLIPSVLHEYYDATMLLLSIDSHQQLAEDENWYVIVSGRFPSSIQVRIESLCYET